MHPSFQYDMLCFEAETVLEVIEKKLEMAAPQYSSLQQQSNSDS